MAAGRPGCLSRRAVGALGVRAAVFVAVTAVALGGCRSKGTASRVDRCTDRFMRAVKPEPSRAKRALIRHYVVVTYCGRFAREGWVYDDGALSIDAQRWLVQAGSEVCVTQTPGEQSTTVPCEHIRAPENTRTIDCAMLRFVRRSEVRTYITELERRGRVQCDEGTPLAALGVP